MSTTRIRGVLASLVVVAAAGLLAQQETAVTLIAYGDTRFTDPSNVTATSPLARAALVARIADEKPDAILLNGGFFIPEILRERVADVVGKWTGRRPEIFENVDLDLAVAIQVNISDSDPLATVLDDAARALSASPTNS